MAIVGCQYEDLESLDNTRTPQYQHTQFEAASAAPVEDKPRRRTSILGVLVRILVAIAVIGFAIYQAIAMISDRPEAPRRQNIERSFTVNVVEPQYGTHQSNIRTFGQVTTTRTIDMRSQVQGRVIEVAPEFVVGGSVEAGEVLARIDPRAYDGAVIEARANLANAELTLRENEEALALEEANVEAAQAALAAARTDLERARQLLQSGSITQQTVESRELTFSERQQTLSQRQNNLFTLQAQINRQTAMIEQARWEVETAQRNRADTEITAPFSGVVTAQAITTGAYVTANEVIGSMYDEAALNVRFTISDQQYGQLNSVGLPGREVTAIWDLRPNAVVIPGQISRTAPEVDAATGGVELFAALDSDAARAVRPGTFVSVEIAGFAYENALRIPETAVYDDDHLYVLREGRMARVEATILARDNGHLIVSADIPEGERIITSRLAQAGEGVAVRVEGEDEPRGGGPGGGMFGGGRPGGG
jgi:membrane fusion protein, multidrug efflux system